ncbi:MAG: Hsp70 family protein, partial [Acidimicrobiia bacterium]|nr:Hsp70 family protein [Acidimicrobiia bacterium]
MRTIGPALGKLDLDIPANRRAVAALRRSMSQVKESLSSDTQVVVPVLLPGTETEIRLTRAEFEDLIRPSLEDTLHALQHLLDDAEVTPDDVHAVLLVGGSSRIPLVTELVTRTLGRPVAIDVHPKFAVAQGAALSATVAVSEPVPEAAPPVPIAPAIEPIVEAVPDAPAIEPAEPGPARRRWILPLVGAALLATLGLFVWQPWSGGEATEPTATDSTTSPPASSDSDSTGTPAASTPRSADPPGLELLTPCDEDAYSGDSIGPGVLASEKVRVDFLGGDRPTGYTVSVHDEDGWFQLARVEPLATIVYIDSAGQRQTLDLSGATVAIGDRSASISSRSTDPDGVTWTVEIGLALDRSPCVVDVVTRLRADRNRQIVWFASPTLDVGRGSFGAAKDTAVLGGLDWTLAGEESQAAAASPHPLDVSWPAMALAFEDHLVGLMWDPLQKWDGANLMPQPLFASPNWIDDSDGHLFALGIPTSPVWVQESLIVDEREATAKQAAAVPIVDRVIRTYDLAAGTELKIESSIMADYPAEIPEAVELYTDRFGLPTLPEVPVAAGVEAVLDSYLETAWDAAAGGWYQGTFGGKAPFITVASQLAAYADQGTERAQAAAATVAQALGPVWQRTHDPGPSSAHMDFIDYGFRTGDTEEVLDWSGGAAAASRASQRSDGSWVNTDTDSGCPGALGERGTSFLGTNAIHASIILEHARITRDPASVEAGLRALEAMDVFRKPAGAQVSGIPWMHGDPWAAAWA